jgi:hypothetical protein
LRLALNVSLAGTADGLLYAAYEGRPTAGDESGVYVRELKDGLWGPQLRIAPAETALSQPSITVDGKGTVYVFCQSDAEDQVRLTTSDDWSVSKTITGAGTNRFPNAAWSLHVAHQRPVELVWTEMKSDAGNPAAENRIRYALVAAGGDGTSPR